MNSFLLETFNRLFKSRSPAFFVRVRFIMAGLALANYLPIVLKRYFNIELPEGMVLLCQDIAQYATGIFGGTFLPTQKASVGKTARGKSIQVTDEKQLPFSAKAEKKEMDKEVVLPPEVIKGVPEEAPKDK